MALALLAVAHVGWGVDVDPGMKDADQDGILDSQLDKGEPLGIQATDLVTPLATSDYYEPDDASYQANTISTGGALQSHTIYPAGDNDWVRFSATAGTSYTIETFAPTSGSGVDTYIYLYGHNSSTNLVRYDDDGGSGLYSRISGTSWTASTGTYYVRIRAYASSQTGGYRISVTASGGPPIIYRSPSSLAFSGVGGGAALPVGHSPSGTPALACCTGRCRTTRAG